MLLAESSSLMVSLFFIGHANLLMQLPEDGTPLSNGAVLYKGFQQSFRWTSAGFPAVQVGIACVFH